MSLKVSPQIFKWLQSMSLVKQGKRANDFLQLPQDISLKFFDGLYIAYIIKNQFTHIIDEQTIKKLDSLKQNSNPAIRLYNWNVLGQVLKKLKGSQLDSSQKSKLLTLEYQPLLKVLKALFQSRQKPSNAQKKGLKVQISQIAKKSLLQSSNAMQFLIISLSRNFKLSPQHTLNLFLDNNKYLSHLLVKGVKNNFAPILQFLREIKTNIDFLVSQIFCLDEEQNVGFFFNGLKSCLISKDDATVWECLEVWAEIGLAYKMKGISLKHIKAWVKNQGLNTLFFVIGKSPQYFDKIIELCYLFLQSQLMDCFQLNEKSLLWNNEKEKLTFLRRLLSMQFKQVPQKFLFSSLIDQWLKHLIKTSKKLKQSQELYDINIIFQSLWLIMGQKFQDQKYNLPSVYMQVIKQVLGLKHYPNFFSVAISLFNLIKYLGNKKNPFAPQLFKLAITTFTNLTSTDQDKIIFFSQNLTHTLKEIKTLPGGSLVTTIIKHLSSSPNLSLLELCKVMFDQKRINQQETVEILQILTKIIFQDVLYGQTVVEMVGQVIQGVDDEVADEYLVSNSKVALANFVSQAKTITKSVKQLKAQLQQEYKNSPSQQQNSKAKSVLGSHFKKVLLINNCLLYLNKYLEIDDINLRNSLQTMLFHTYVKVKVQLKKKTVADMLLPLMRKYYEEDDELNGQIDEVEKEHYPEQDSKEYSSKITLLKSIKLGKSLDLSSIETSDLKTIDPSSLRPSQFALKDLEILKQKREHLKTIQLQKQKQTLDSQSKIKQIKNFMNQKRLIEFGSSGKIDFDYRNLYEFDSMKQEEVISGVPLIRLVNFERQEEETYEEDLRNVMKKYRKVWRFLFFKYSTFGAKKQQFKTQEKINMAEIWKMMKQYEVFSFLKKQESQTIIKLINDNMKRKNDPQCLTYPGFQEYITQLCTYAYTKSTHPHLPPSRQVLLFLQQLKRQTKQKGGSIDLFDNPQDIYFQQTDVIREYNRRLKQNPDYILPEGYKKYKQFSVEYEYCVHPMLQRNLKTSLVEVYEVLHEILFEKLGMGLIQPISLKNQVTLAKPVLFQNISEKMKDYKKGYLQPKATIQLKQDKAIELRKSIILKRQFKPHINFSLGIKLGLSSVSIKNKSIGEEVAYWMHDMLNAIENQSLKVDNTAKKKVENVIIKRRRVQSLEKLKKQRSEKKDWKKRAQSVKVRLEMQKKLKEQENTKKKQTQIEQKRKKRVRQEQSLKKKLSRFEQMKKIISQRKQQAKYKKIEEQDKRKERLQEYKSKVEEYFEKKKEQIIEKQEQMKKQKEEKEKEEQEKKQKQQNFVKQLYLNNLKKQEDILEKAQELKEKYEQLWESDQITEELQKYEKQLHYLFNLLLKYEKSKISATSFDEIGLNTLHYFALKFMVIPFMVEKTELIKIFNFVIKQKQKRLQKQNEQKEIEEIQLTTGPAKAKSPGLNFKNFQQTLLLIAIKAKKLLNKIKEKRNKRMEKLLQFIKQKKSEDDENHFDVQDMSESEQQSDEEEEEEDEKAPGLLQQYLFNVDDVDEQTLKQVFVFLKLPKDKLGVEERYRTVVESKNLKPKNIVKAELKKQMETVKLEDLKQEDLQKSQDSDNDD